MEDSNLRQTRIEKLAKLKEKGIDSYPASTHRTHTIAQALQNEGKEVATAGRMMSFREHGNIAFADIKDETDKIQIFFQKKLLGNEAFKNLKLLDIGDFIQVEGIVTKTVAGEISITPISCVLLTKSLLPLPSNWYGLKDPEIRLRKRYLDLIINTDIKDYFRKKALFWQTIREYLIAAGGLEVETPVLVPTAGGADARPFVTHHFAQDMELYLRISPELYLKRLLVGGFEKVFEIGRIFRNEGIDDEHLQDYTQMEMYWAYKNYDWLMDFVEEMTKEVIKKVFGSLKTSWKGHEIDWSGKWARIEFMKLLSEKWNVNAEKLSIDELYLLAKKLKVHVEPNLGRGRLLDYLYKKTIRPELIQPVFLINHPVEVEPLAKRLKENPNNVQRMQILAMGSELGKGFSELNDPIDQYERFMEQQQLRDAGDEEAQMMDEDFVEALEYGMPPAAGFAYSERLFAMLVDKPVREMVFFPTMKPEANKEKIKKEEGKIVPQKQIVQPIDAVHQDFSKRFVVVLNKELPTWQAMNALGHMSAFLGNKLNESFDTGETFAAKDTEYPRNSQYPIIILSAKPGQLQNLLEKVKTSGILYHAFIREMIETTNDSEIEKTLVIKKASDIELLGIGIFGANEEVEKLTKNYSLWK